MSKPYKRPVIATIFECIGGAAFVASVFAFIAAWVDAASGQSAAPQSIAGAVCVIMAAVYFGIGQIIDSLGRASHRNELIGSILVEQILPELRALNDRFASPVAGPPPPTETE